MNFNTNFPQTTPATQSLWGRIKKLFKRPTSKRQVAIIIAASVLLISTTGVGAYLLLKGDPAPTPAPEPAPVAKEAPPPAPEKFYSQLTGAETAKELSTRPITGVMIENSIDARPQAGLQEAGIVFEAIAEGGITRFLALYQEARPEHIGPIRSARPYYVRWAAGYDAAYVHSGGSGEALSLIQSLGIKDMDHGRFGESVALRVSNRYAPHNVYASMDRLDAKRAELGYTTSTFTPFERAKIPEPLPAEPVVEVTDGSELTEPKPAIGSPASTINFNISGPQYNTSYTYDSATKTYARVMAGQAHLDERSGKQIAPRVVVALYMSYSIHADGVHSVYGNVGEGRATVYQNGSAFEARWQKPTDSASLKLVDLAGVPIPLERGQTWITAIQEGRVTSAP